MANENNSKTPQNISDLENYGDVLEVDGVSENDVNAFIKDAAGKGGVGKVMAENGAKTSVDFGDGQTKSNQVVATKNSLISKVEIILEEGLDSVCFNMPTEKQIAFSQNGELAAKEITLALETGVDKKARVASIIRNWLSVIPGVSPYFLEQEIKIKTDEIVKLI